ncbi:MAG: antitoxin [Acidimicrobiia bacterium]|nr:antitoxin [Acidimicrobiia bacterium]MYC58091.1 antitoxin [Acidimicrobiia bacterium]MYG93830.1 antitoxin [Acidimicrobiia bacterium]MYI30736.1 antitoxin [Acidimicrobiia bacterium]
MRTTVDLPEDIHTLASELAHQQRKTMSEVLVEFIRDGLNSLNEAEVNEKAEVNKSGWPTVTIGRIITAEDVRSLEDEW